jgi:PPP family 3-phenylpropionic acid transporter
MTEPTPADRAPRLLPFAVLSASYFAFAGFFTTYLPLWLKDMGLSLVTISLLTSIQALTRLFAPYAWGALSDRTGERVKLLRLGAVVALVASLGLGRDLGVWWLVAVLLIMFTSSSAMMPMNEAAIAHVVSRSGTFDIRRYGRVRLCGSLGFLVTVFAAGAWFDFFGMTHFPLISTLTLLVVALSAGLLPDLKETPHATEVALPIWPILKQRPVQWFFAALFFHVLSHMSLYTFFSLYLDALGYSKTVIGLLWAVSVVAEIAWFFTQGQWLPRLGLSAWMILCSGVMALRMGVTATSAPILVVLILAQVLHALTFAAHHSVCIALLSHHFPGRLRGRGQALFTVIGYGIPGVLAGILGGLISTRYGLASIFWVAAGTSLVAMACAIKVWRTQHPHPGAAG